MKRRMMAVALAAVMACSLAACGSNSTNDSTESGSTTTTTAANRTANPPVASMEMDIDADELVELCDYVGIPVTLTATYSLTDDQIDQMIVEDLQYYGLGYVEEEERTVIEEGDIVNLDYTGYQDGEAFDGGSATDQMVSISDDSGYIDGFVDGLIGTEVGQTLSYEVTFPDDYSNNEDLAGQTVTFEFTTYGIYRAATLDEMPDVVSDDDIDDLFGDYGLSTLQDFIDYERDYVTEYLSYLHNDAVKDEVETYLLDNCTVTIPDDYLQARLTEYEIMYEDAYLDDDEDLETYLNDNYSVTMDEAIETWTSSLEEEISYELIYTKIADLEGLEVDEDLFTTYVNNIVSNYGYTDAEEMYEYYGAGITANGEAYMRMMYHMNQGADFVVENADVSYDVEDDTETTEAVEETEE